MSRAGAAPSSPKTQKGLPALAGKATAFGGCGQGVPDLPPLRSVQAGRAPSVALALPASPRSPARGLAAPVAVHRSTTREPAEPMACVTETGSTAEAKAKPAAKAPG